MILLIEGRECYSPGSCMERYPFYIYIMILMHRQVQNRDIRPGSQDL